MDRTSRIHSFEPGNTYSVMLRGKIADYNRVYLRPELR